MAPRSALLDGDNLTIRIVSSAVIVPVVTAAVWLGAWPYTIFLAVLAGVACWEWAKVSAKSGLARIMIPCAALTPVVALGAGLRSAVIVAVFGAAIVLAGAWLRREPAPWIVAAGVPYVLISVLSLYWLRVEAGPGLETVLWLVAVVAATDIAAYFAGRSIGGPKLAPRLSPKKTWAGLVGGMAAAAVVGASTAVLLGSAGMMSLVLVSVGLAVAAQAGDLIESAFKRRFDVKDASGLIPGHGGVLDRIDGYLTAAPVVALMTVVRDGSPVTWQ